MMDSIITPGELCKLLKIEYHRYRYLLCQGKIPAPRATVLGSRKFYTIDDAKRIREILHKDTKKREKTVWPY